MPASFVDASLPEKSPVGVDTRSSSSQNFKAAHLSLPAFAWSRKNWLRWMAPEVAEHSRYVKHMPDGALCEDYDKARNGRISPGPLRSANPTGGLGLSWAENCMSKIDKNM
jgi:hypothetical protein